MFLFSRAAGILLTILICCATTSIAATEDEIQKVLDQNKTSENSKSEGPETSHAEPSPRSNSQTNMSAEDLKILLDRARETGEETDIPKGSETAPEKAQPKVGLQV